MEGIDGEVLQGLRMQYATEEQMEEAAAFKPKRWLQEAVQNFELPSVAGFFKNARLWEAVQNLELPSVAGFFKTVRFNSLEQKIAQVRLPCPGVGDVQRAGRASPGLWHACVLRLILLSCMSRRCCWTPAAQS